jgi:hypothetical protein
MKKMVLGIVFVFMAGLFYSAHAQSGGLYRPINPSEMNNFNIIGTVQIKIDRASTSLDGTPSEANKEEAYIRLLNEAKRIYQRYDIDIRNVSVINTNPKRWSPVTLIGNGDVVVPNGRNTTTGVEGALERAVESVSKDFTPRSRIAIVQITAPDRSTRDFMIGELEYILQQQGYYIVDRAQLDKIFEEQRFGTTSDVDDNTAARMGHLAGASVVITGRVDGEGNLRRLRLRALNTETAQVIGTASERL